MSPKALGDRGEPTTEETEAFEKARQRAEEAEAFGRTIGDSGEAWQKLAVKRGKEGLTEALISRHNQRWQNVYENLAFAAAIVLPRLSRVVAIDAALVALGVPYEADKDPITSPASYGDGWLGHLRWGADSVASTARFLLVSQSIGAAALARQQLERWTDNRATALGRTRNEGESKADFIDRVWLDGLDTRFPPGAALEACSEILHGRGGPGAAG